MNTIISSSVGLKGTNLPSDVRTIQIMLNGGLHSSPLQVDGIIGPKTIQAIEQFQIRQLGLHDGLISVDGPTHQALRRLFKLDPSFVRIPDNIDGIRLEFGEDVNRNVDKGLVQALRSIITSSQLTGVRSIYISSAMDSHTDPSRHMVGKAVDISRINGKRMANYYHSDPIVKAATDHLQNAFETIIHRRENFGPCMKRKLGSTYTISGHQDHIHFSVQ